MFTGNMVTEAIPTRVFALYRIANSKKDISRNEVMSLMEPDGIREGKSSYYNVVLKAAMELNLVQTDNNLIIPLVPKEKLQDIDDFRAYVISKLNNFSDEQFYKCTNAIMNLNEKIYSYNSISDNDMLNFLSNKAEQQINPPMARGLRFWLQFLGFGYMQDFVFLPNAYVFVKNVICMMDLEKKQTYKMDDFMGRFTKYGGILSDNMTPDKHINLAFSNALRELHDNNEIELVYGSDAENRWTLFPSAVAFDKQIDSIVYKGVKK
jgi:hypothetical protein